LLLKQLPQQLLLLLLLLLLMLLKQLLLLLLPIELLLNHLLTQSPNFILQTEYFSLLITAQK
jgi:hypothetical protein